MAPCRQAVAALGVVLSLSAVPAAAWADYPDFTAGGQTTATGRREYPPAYAKPEASAGGSEPKDNDAVPRELPIRYPSAERQAAAPAHFAAGGHAPPQRLVVHERAVSLPPPSAETHAAQRAADKPPLLTGAASLGIVLGLFLLVAWAVRRGMPRTAAWLPREAVELLGRAPLVGRQQVHLVRCGNKVLLLSVSASSAETLTEITDADEVERLADICHRAGASGVSASFRQVFGQFGGAGRLDHLARGQEGELDFAHLEAEVGRRSREARG